MQFTAPVISLFIITSVAATAAQTASITAILEGTVSDNTGGVIPDAEVRLRNTASNQVRTVRANEQGFFRASELPVGTYEISVEHSGFALYHHTGITLAIGQTIRLNIELAPAGAASQVTITEQPPPIDASQTALTTTIDTEKIEELPVRSRNYLNFVLLAPGVAPSNQQQTASAQTQLADSGFTFGGLRARSNNLSIDGLDNNDEYTGSSRTELSLEIVREFQVVNNGLSAEFGGASGGSINVITRTGTNEVHGDAFLFVQSGAVNARPPLSNESRKPDLSRYRAGLAIGGPIVKGRTFYYTAFEQEHTRSESSSDIDPAVASAINNFLATSAFPRITTRDITDGFFPIARAETEASGKFNHQLNQEHSLMLRYAFSNNRELSDAFNTGGLTDTSARGSRFTEDHALVGSLVSLFGTRAVGDLRFQLATRRAVSRTNDQAGPGIDINGLINFGRPYEGNDRRRESHYQASYTIVLTKGAHLIKVGITANHVRLRSVAQDGFGAVYIFSGLTDFFAGHAESFRQAFGDPITQLAVTSYSSFIQDHWSFRKRITFDFGLRYDFEHLPDKFNQDINDLSPRVGIAYSPSKKWVLRAGFGLFHDRYVLAFLNRDLEKDGSNAFEQVADEEAATKIFRRAAGGSVQAPVSEILPSIFRADPRLATSYSEQASFGIEHLLTKTLTASSTYLFVRGLKLSRTRNVNLLPPAILTERNALSLAMTVPASQQFDREFFGPARHDPRFNDIYLLEGSASSTYHGMSLALNKRLANEFELSASYTFSKTIDDASDFDEQPDNPLNLKPERALSRNHQGHRFVLSALYDLPFGEEENKAVQPTGRQGHDSELLVEILSHIQIAPIITVGSGRPINPLTGLDSNRSHAFPLSSRPPGFGRNTLKLPSFATADLRLLKYFHISEHDKLDFVAEVFNIFNRVNINELNPFFGSNSGPISSFARPVGAFNPRQFQFSIDFEF